MLMTMLIDEEGLPCELDTRAWLFLEVESYEISDRRYQALVDSFRREDDLDENVFLCEEDLSRVPNFITVKNVVTLPGVRDDLSFVRGVFCLQNLRSRDEDALLAEIRVFTDLLLCCNRISLAEQGQMERGFLDFVINFRRVTGAIGSAVECTIIDLLRYCSSRGARNLLRSVFCLDVGMQGSVNLCCDGIGHLSGDVTSGVCSVILGYLAASRIRSYESVSGPLLEEVVGSHRRLVDVSELSESMLWDDVGVVAGEDYRLQLYTNLGYDINGERAASPEIGN